MAGTESSYLGDDQIFLFILSLEVVGEIGRQSWRGDFSLGAEVPMSGFIYESCMDQHSWMGQWPEAA